MPRHPKLTPNWRVIVRKAWSMRLLAIAGILTALEAVLPLFTDAVPRGAFVLLNLIVIPAALVSRVVAQEGLDDD
jgi:hypothetical protein